MYFFLFLICTTLASESFAAPYYPAILQRDSPSDKSGLLSLNVTDRNNVDVTSKFEIMVFQQPQIPIIDNLTNNTINPRQYLEIARPMTHCIGAAFVESYCTPEHDRAGSLQSYLITCAEWINQQDPWSGQYHRSNVVHRHRGGHCENDEVCVNAGIKMYPHMPAQRCANCIKKTLFGNSMYGPGDGETKQRINMVLQRRDYHSAYMVASKKDGSTPTEVDTFNVDAWPEVGEKQSRRCRDCMDLQAKGLASNMNAMEAEARLLTTGVAAAGILWLALMTG